MVALALLLGACSGGGSDEVAPSTTAAVAPTTAPGAMAVPLDELRLSTERRVAIGSGDDAVLLVDGSHSSAGGQIAAWLIDRDDPTVAVPVALPIEGRHGPTRVVPWAEGFLVVTGRCPSDALDEPRSAEPSAVDAPCGTSAHDVVVVPGDGSGARAVLVDEAPDGELARQMMIGAVTPTAAFLHWPDETGGYLVASIDGDVVVVEPLGRAVSTFCSVGDEIYAVGESRFVGGRAEAPRPIGEFVDLARLEDGAWVPVAVPGGPPEQSASPTGCGDGRIVFATLDEDVTGVRVLDLRPAAPTWAALPVPEHDGGSGRVVANGIFDRVRLRIGGSPSTYVWDDATASWVVDESFCCGLVDNGLIELVPHPSGEGLAVQLVPGS